jgi:hypothetical protein
MASISSISGSVAILKSFYLSLEQSIIVSYPFSYYVIRFWEIRKFLTNGLGESACIRGDSTFTARAKTPTSNRFKILKKIRNDCVSL